MKRKISISLCLPVNVELWIEVDEDGEFVIEKAELSNIQGCFYSRSVTEHMTDQDDDYIRELLEEEVMND